jgi:hypothetical protein
MRVESTTAYDPFSVVHHGEVPARTRGFAVGLGISTSAHNGLRDMAASEQTHHVVEVNINLGGIGCMKICPTWEDIQIAHQIWTELVTRKAAIPFDPEDDLIVEIYDSWYALFQRTRQLIGDIPGKCIRRDKSTQQIVKIATESLNLGLRPHLTKWQARYRNWWRNSEDALKTVTPQEHQKTFPRYAELIEEMLGVNKEMIEYAAQLQKIVKG